jgi:hypothetical protein
MKSEAILVSSLMKCVKEAAYIRSAYKHRIVVRNRFEGKMPFRHADCEPIEAKRIAVIEKPSGRNIQKAGWRPSFGFPTPSKIKGIWIRNAGCVQAEISRIITIHFQRRSLSENNIPAMAQKNR